MTPTCPRCNQPLIRARRKPSDHIISRILPVRRFQCTYHSCRWNGLRIYRAKDASASTTNRASFPDTKFREDSIQD